jgi:hypothetical protein
MRKRLGVPTILSLALLAHAAAAYGGASSASPTDPSAGSPAGAVYQLPFEKGRADAAPKGNGGTGAPGPGSTGGGGDGGGAGGGGASGASGEPNLYRSENNFGSSSHVPGVGAEGSQGGAGNVAGGNDSGGGAGNGSQAGGSDSGSGSGLTPGTLTDSGNTSPVANIGLLLVIVLMAGGVGYVSLRGKRLHQS